MTLITHSITFVLLALSLFLILKNVFLIPNAHRTAALRFLLYTLCIFQTLTLIAFAVNQLNWIVSDHESIVGSQAQLGWLAYDYLNKLFHLTCAATLHYYLSYKHVSKTESKRRRSADA